MSDFRNQLLTNKYFNPFNRAFDVVALQNSLKSWGENLPSEDKGDLMPMIDTCRVITLLSAVFESISKQIENNLLSSGLSYPELIACLVAQHNGTYTDMMMAYRNAQDGFDHIELTDLFAHRSNSTDPSIGMINTSGGLVATIDVINALMGSAAFFKDQMNTVSDQPDSLSIFYLNQLDLISNVYFGFKTSYDSLVCNDGFYKVTGKNQYKVWFKDHKRMGLEEIGRFRTQQDSVAHYLQLKGHLSKDPQSKFYPKEWLNKKINNVQIATVSYTKVGYINYELSPGHDVAEQDEELSFFSAVEAFYSFLENAALPRLRPLRIWDVLCLFSMVQHLFSKAANVAVPQGDCYTVAEIHNIPFRIDRKVMIDYLLARTTYTTAEIESFINLLSNKSGERINFWERPFLPSGDDLLVPLLTTVAPVTYYLIDHWLETGGYPLEKRGKALEKYVKENVHRQLTTKGYWFHIPTANRFRISNGAYEEIDLLVVLKDIVVIAEIKCIRYPLEPFDYHFSFNRLNEGAEQVNKKTDFLLANAEELRQITGDIRGKKIVRAVITNYPIFTGCIIHEVPVIDFCLFEAYLKHNQINHFVSFTDKERVVKEQTGDSFLYNDESEFGDNLDDFLRNNSLLNTYESKVDIHDQKMTVNEFPVQVYLEMAAFRESKG